MNLPSRPFVVALSCAVLALIGVGGIAAYAATPARDGGIHGCVNAQTGILRVVDPGRGQGCRTARGYFQEYAVMLSQAAGLPGPRGPVGPRGPAGDGVDSLDALAGLPCNVDTPDEGVVEIRIAPPERGSAVQMLCRTDGTTEYVPPPPTTVPPRTTPPRPTTEPPTMPPPPVTTEAPMPTTQGPDWTDAPGGPPELPS